MIELLKQPPRRIFQLSLWVIGICWGQPSYGDISVVEVEARGYDRVPQILAEMTHPYSRVPRLVLSRAGGYSFVSCEVFPRSAVPQRSSLLELLRHRLSTELPEARWGWGGVYQLGGREWAAWEFTAPSMDGAVSSVIAATLIGQSVVAVALSCPSDAFPKLEKEFGGVLAGIVFR